MGERDILCVSESQKEDMVRVVFALWAREDWMCGGKGWNDERRPCEKEVCSGHLGRRGLSWSLRWAFCRSGLLKVGALFLVEMRLPADWGFLRAAAKRMRKSLAFCRRC